MRLACLLQAVNPAEELGSVTSQALDMVRAGTARVEVRSLATGDPTPAGTPAAYYAQAGAFTSRDNAEALAGRLRDAGIEGVTVSESQAGRGPVYRVRAGPAASLPDFDRLVERMLAAGAEAVRLAL